MNNKTCYLLSALLFALLFSFRSTAQKPVDTIYFDETWSICEQPVAAYYRVGALNKVFDLFFKGPAKDYFIDGQLEMTGQYDGRGLKKGRFIFYNQKGLKVKEGDYDDDQMKGIWSFYDDNGNLKAEFDCASNTDFTPLLIVNSAGDTLLKNGNGRFSFNSAKDLPNVFFGSREYTVSGEVVNGKKEGVFAYGINAAGSQSKFEEYYVRGKFTKAADVNAVFGENEVRVMPYTFLNAEPESLQHIDNFYSNNLAFNVGKDRDRKLIRFLTQNETPEMESDATSYSDNTKDIFNVISTVLNKRIVKKHMSNISRASPHGALQSLLLSFNIAADSASPPVIEATGDFDIDTSGYITKTIFKGNLDSAMISNINFYLSHVSRLFPYMENGQKKPSRLGMHIYTVVKSAEGDAANKTKHYSYYGSVLQDDRKP